MSARKQLATAYQLNEFQLFFSSACIVVKLDEKLCNSKEEVSEIITFQLRDYTLQTLSKSVQLIKKKIDNSSMLSTSPYSRSFALRVFKIKASTRHNSGWLLDDELWLSDLNLQNQTLGCAVDNGTKILEIFPRAMFFDVTPLPSLSFISLR